MNIYITYERTFFTEEQINSLSKLGNLIFLESFFELDEAKYLKDNEEKIIMADPEWYKWNLNKEHLSRISNLKALCINTTAFEWVDIEYCNENNILVTNTPKYSTESVAEYAIFLMMSLAKNLSIQIKNDYQTNYGKEMLQTEIKGKTVGIIGLGTIGTRIAELCSNLGMKVIYWSKSNKENKHQKVSIDEIFKKADFIIPAFSTNEETKTIITDERIKSMHGNYFINIVNNPILLYNHELMIKKAENNEIGYAFEIYNNENLNNYKGNVMVLPPYAFFTKESIDRLVEIWCNNVIGICTSNIQNLVNL